ncbi:hypothetical protein ABPG72_019817 [Tetrahymena utriculariae]
MIRTQYPNNKSQNSQICIKNTLKLDQRSIQKINSHLQKQESTQINNNPALKVSYQSYIHKQSIETINKYLKSTSQAQKITASTLTITGFNTQGVAKTNKRNKQYSTLYLQRIFSESDVTILLETNCKENSRVDVHNPSYTQMNNSCKQRQVGAGTASVYLKETKIAPYLSSLNNEKMIAQVLILDNKQRILIMGLHMQLQSNPVEEQALLEEVIKQVLKDNRLNHILIYGDFNLDFTSSASQNKDSRRIGQINRLKEFLKSKQLYIHSTNRHTREAFKQNCAIKTQVDFFISSFAPQNIIQIETITSDESNRGSDHFPIRIKINLESAKARDIKQCINKKQLDLITEKLQKYLCKSQKSDIEIRDKINSVKQKLELKPQNTKQLRRNINERINSIIKAVQRQEKVQKNNDQAKTRAEQLRTRRKIIHNRDTKIQEQVNLILKEYYAESTKQVQELYKVDSKKYYQNIKRICNMGKKSNVLDMQNGPIENSNEELLFDSKEIQEELIKYFKEHYKSDLQTDYYHTIGKLSSNEIENLIQSSDQLFSSKNKAFSSDYIKDQCFLFPKRKNIFKEVQTTSSNQNSIKEKALQIIADQNQHRDYNLRVLLKDILSNPEYFKNTFNARQIYLLKSESRKIINCRPITIQSSIIKILENSMLKHYQTLKDKGQVKNFHISQCGFQKNRSTIINICRTIAIIQNTVAKKENRVAIFVDVKSAFDSVNHKQLFQALKNQGFDDIFIKAVAFLYQNSRINGYQIGRGVIQGGKLSPILFNYLYEEVRVKILQIWKSKNHQCQDLHFELFADDMLIILKNYKHTKILLEVLKQAYSDLNLQINESKTKIMLIGKQEAHIKDSLKLRQAKGIDVVMEFKYLGLVISNNGKIHKDVSKKIEKAKNLTQMLKRWRYNRLGVIPCLILWQLFIKSQLQYASAIIISSDQSEKCLRSLRNMYNSSLREVLGLNRSTSISTICKVLGIENIESMILNSFDNLMNQVNSDRRIKMQFRVFTKNIKFEIMNRYQKLLQEATSKNNKVKGNFWWKFGNQHDNLIKLNIYLQNPNGQFCWKCAKFYKGDYWLQCQHKIEAWTNLQKLLGTTLKSDILKILNSQSHKWTQLSQELRPLQPDSLFGTPTADGALGQDHHLYQLTIIPPSSLSSHPAHHSLTQPTFSDPLVAEGNNLKYIPTSNDPPRLRGISQSPLYVYHSISFPTIIYKFDNLIK